MIDWASLTLREHDAVVNALKSLSADLRAEAVARIDARAQGEPVDEGRLLDAARLITNELGFAIDDLEKRDARYAALIKEQNSDREVHSE